MEIPICDGCAKTGVLCSNCEAKLGKGEISELDVELAKTLHETGHDDVGFERVVDVGDSIIILTKKKFLGKLIGKGGENLRMLSNKLGKNVRIVGTENLQDTIRDLIAPAHISSINKVYLSDGKLLQRIKIRRGEKGRLRMDLKEIQKVISSLTTDKIELVAEE